MIARSMSSQATYCGCSQAVKQIRVFFMKNLNYEAWEIPWAKISTWVVFKDGQFCDNFKILEWNLSYFAF